MQTNIIIIPDIHGRTFWKSAIPHDITGHTIIFLGDYLDPYENEVDIDWWSMWDRFQEIIALKKAYPDNIVLLLGNHDLHYLWSDIIPHASRFNEYQAEKISSMFKDNLHCFRIAYCAKAGGKSYLFTHAGVSRRWIANHPEVFSSPDEVNDVVLNEKMSNPAFIKALADISKYRGGTLDAGSLVWADRAELEYPGNWIGEYVQVFGHTQGIAMYSVTGRAYCLDCRQAFKLSDNGITLLR